MVFRKEIFLSLFLALFVFCKNVEAVFPLVSTRPYDVEFETEAFDKSKFHIADFGEISFSNFGCNADAEKVNVMQIWQANQNSLAMLKGFSDTTAIGQLRNLLDTHGANDDGVRGRFVPEGDFNWADCALAFRYNFANNFSILAHVPLCFAKLGNVTWKNQTKSLTAGDLKLKDKLTDDFASNLKTLGKGLEIDGWDRYGFGDIDFVVMWNSHFLQAKPWLKDVELRTKLGLTIPTGVKKDEDKALSVPFGNDGSVGLLFGGAINLRWFKNLKGGVRAEFMNVFSNTRERRIKTNNSQTDLLLLEKVNAQKSYGFTQHFTLHLGLFRIFKGLSFQVSYDHWRHNDDSLVLLGNSCSTTIANTAKSLGEWSSNTVQFNLNYDFSVHQAEDATLKPMISVFYRAPIKARSAIVGHFVGAQISVKF